MTDNNPDLDRLLELHDGGVLTILTPHTLAKPYRRLKDSSKQTSSEEQKP